MDRHPQQPAVLVVEDNEGVLGLLKLALQQYGFNPILAAYGQEAVDIYQQQQDRIALVLMDVQMPGLDGPGTLDALRKINPAVRCCFMSGHPGKYNEADLQEGGSHFIWKPFRLSELSDLLRELAD